MGPDGWLGLNLSVSLHVALATIGIYATLLVLVRIAGQRSLATMSGTDFACAVALGAVIGRTTLLGRPTLGAGVVALATLIAVRSLLAAGRDWRLVQLLTPKPVILLVDGQPHLERMRRAGVSPDDLRQSLRLAGITRLDEVGRVVLESNGRLSVLRAGGELDHWLVEDLT